MARRVGKREAKIVCADNVDDDDCKQTEINADDCHLRSICGGRIEGNSSQTRFIGFHIEFAAVTFFATRLLIAPIEPLIGFLC